ncbi:inorganic phosphate transporter [Niabella hibiscisoli]|nr:inorganic phosphate transporter [Niabella hibiscisoli]
MYTKALKPQVAAPWSGFCNFPGVLTGGIAVAMGILKLVPLNEIMAQPIASGACLVLAVLVSATFWNLGTWYLGIPCSSSHTTIGSMIGASIGFTYYYGGGVNWSKAGEIGLFLLMSPLFGFGVAMLNCGKKFMKYSGRRRIAAANKGFALGGLKCKTQ